MFKLSVRRDGGTERRSDGATERRTDTADFRDAETHLKTGKQVELAGFVYVNPFPPKQIAEYKSECSF